MTTDSATAAIRFRIRGALRFLSHAETARLWQRACARAGVDVQYSQGFNPHPRLSLSLPRPVGVESDDELLVLKLSGGDGATVENRAERETALQQALTRQLPEGMEVRAVELRAGHASFQPLSAEYIFPLRMEGDAQREERLRDEIARVMGSEHCLVERTAPAGRAARSLDVRPFLQGIRLEGGNLIVQHATSGAGSIRVDEILRLFGLQVQDLAGPIRRTHVIWENSKQNTLSEEPCMETRAEDIEDGT